MSIRAVHDQDTRTTQKQLAHSDAVSIQCCPTEQHQSVIFLIASITQKLREPWHWGPFPLNKHFWFVHIRPWVQLQVEMCVNQQTPPKTGCRPELLHTPGAVTARMFSDTFKAIFPQANSKFTSDPPPVFQPLLQKTFKAVNTFPTAQSNLNVHALPSKTHSNLIHAKISRYFLSLV